MRNFDKFGNLSDGLSRINRKRNSFDNVLRCDGCPDAGRGDLAGLTVSFRNVKKP